MDKKICSECGTENEQEYIYCKNCGALLGTAKTEPQKAPAVEFISDKKTEPEYRNTESETANPQGGQRQYYGTQYTPYSSSSYTIGGVSGGMLAAGLVCIVVVNNAVSLVTALISMI